MKVAVVGLGMEGRMAVRSLLNFGHQVYASDLQSDLQIDFDDHEDLCEIDLGSHDWGKINRADAIVLSPSLWKKDILEKINSKDKFLSCILNEHRSIFTIGVTGTNGKTTTSLMIKSILEKSGFKVLIGGNAGGGFEGYTKIMLEASKADYDYLIVEVCDMTLDYCSDNFDFDLMVVTNLGYDHINIHGTLEKFQEKLKEFLRDKKAVLNINDERLQALEDFPLKTYFFDTYPGELKLLGNFNRQNAAAAAKVAEILKIPDKNIINSLEAFNAVAGRISELKFGKTRIIIGKTDNISAITAVFQEFNPDLAILGTPRQEEYWRFDIFQEVTDVNPKLVGLFTGLDNTTIQAKEVLKKNGYQGPIKIFDDIAMVLDFLTNNHEKFQIIFIGGNGQAKIMEIKKLLEQNILNI